MPRAARWLLAPALCLAMIVTGCSASVTVDDQATPSATSNAAPATTSKATPAKAGGVIPKSSVENDITSSLEKKVGQRPDKVECPGDLRAQNGESIRCVLHAGTDRLGVTATVTSASVQNGKVDYKLDVKVEDKPKS